MASFDEKGLKIDRLADVYKDISDSLVASFGDSLDLDERSPIGIIVGIMSERYALLYELLEGVYNASFPSNAFGVYLDYICALNGITRNPAVASTVDLTFTRSNEANSGQVEIPAGTQVKADTNDTIFWTVDAAGFIANGDMTGTVRATCSETGPNPASVDSLTFMPAIPTNVESVTNLQAATLGSNEETDEELRARRELSLAKAATPTQLGITTALRNMPSIASATVIVNDTDQEVDGRPPHSFEAYVSPTSEADLGQISTLTFNREFVDGDSVEVFVNADSKGVIDFDTDNTTTMSLIANVIKTDVNILNASVGADTVIDIQGNSNVAYTCETIDKNSTGITSDFSVVVPNGDLINRVAQRIWDSKAAGIEAVGDITGQAVDINGSKHDVSFSTINPKPVFVKYTLKVEDVDAYDEGNNDTIAEALALFAQINYTAGVDVLVWQLVTIAGEQNVAGVLGIKAETSIDGFSYNELNVPIGDEEFALIPTTNITFEIE